jgi:hypothetical protein
MKTLKAVWPLEFDNYSERIDTSSSLQRLDKITFEIWGSHSTVDSSQVLSCDSVYCYGKISTFRRAILPPSSGWKQHGPPKRWCPTTKLHGITTQKTLTFTSTFFKWGTLITISRFVKLLCVTCTQYEKRTRKREVNCRQYSISSTKLFREFLWNWIWRAALIIRRQNL